MEKLRSCSNEGLLTAYFKWYNAIIAIITKTFEPIVAAVVEYNKTCTNFPTATLTSSDLQQQFNALCPDLLYHSRNLQDNKIRCFVMTSQGGDIKGSSFLSSFESVYMSFRNHMGQALWFYDWSKNCVNSLLKKSLPLAKTYIDCVIANRTKATANLTAVYKSSMTASSITANDVKALNSRLKACASKPASCTSATCVSISACVSALVRFLNKNFLNL